MILPPGEKIVETKKCRISGEDFFVTDKDLEFYDKVSPIFNGKKYGIPSPILCPDERQRRRLCFRNERNLYQRKCDKTGQDIISIYSPDKPFPVYEQDVWWSDVWNPEAYGRSFDLSHPFFPQFRKLNLVVPKLNVMTSQNENCTYTHLTANNRNCYLIFECSNNENCYYGLWMQLSKDCLDCDFIHECECCYQTSDSYNCYELFYSRDCHNCRDSFFMEHCIGCQKCFGCLNLKNKQYYIYNREVTPAQFDTFLKKFFGSTQQERNGYMEHKIQLERDLPRKYANLLQTENCIGDYMTNAKNCIFTSHAHDAEDCKYAEHVWRNAKNVMDVSTVGRNAAWVYESINTGIDVNNNLFCIQAWTSQQLIYSASCFNSQSSFGSTGLKKSHHCILNKPYSVAEYEELCGKIIDHMRSTGEWGEFFPHEISPFGYNETVAQEYFPMTEEAVKAKGWNWYNEPPKKFEGNSLQPLSIDQYDEKIVGFETAQKNIDQLLNGILTCETTKKPFKIIRQELAFYIENHIPIPTIHPDVRHLARMRLRNPWKLIERTCAECKKDIITTYAPERLEKVVCEECYRKLVY